MATRFGRSFIVATVAAKVRGLDITCGCFGHASKNWGFSTHFALDLVLLGALLFLGAIAQLMEDRLVSERRFQ
ncbi:MAG: MauE/DoxX family redox-associated membrane protein [Chthoniobacterales bacterium]